MLWPIVKTRDFFSSLLGPPWLTGLLAMVVVPASRRIVLAGDTGVWWSEIPTPATLVGGYTWQQAQGLTTGTFSGLAVGPDESVIAAAWGANPATGHHGLFRGEWDSAGTLTFDRAAAGGLDTATLFRTSVASCTADPRRLYAVGAASDNAATSGIAGVIRSNDGGASWSAATVPMNPGGQGEYNNCIAVSRTRPDIVVIGWRGGGAFYSADGAASWSQPHTDGGPTVDRNLHSDLHALYFARDPGGVDELYVGSDGGVMRTRDLGNTNDSEYAQQIRNLQFYPNVLAVSSDFPGLIAGGTQDNGNIFCRAVPNPQHFPEPIYWQNLEGGDGGVNRFVDGLGALLRANNTLADGNGVEFGNQVRLQFWDDEHRRFTGRTWAGKHLYGDFAWDPAKGDFGGFGRMIKADVGGGPSGGLVNAIVEVVAAPSWSWDGQPMYAVASPMNTPQGPVYGLFAIDNDTGARWRKLADVGVQVASLASYDGATVLVGTTDGRILSLDSASRQAAGMTLPDGIAGTGNVVRIDVTASSPAMLGQRALAYHDLGGMLRLAGNNWVLLGGGFTAFALDPAVGSRRAFAATDDRVYVSDDDGTTWTVASQGLPERPHCTDLRVGKSPSGGRDLYLATYGRSVWRAQIELPPAKPPAEITPSVSEVLAGVIQDGGGLIFVGGKIVRVPPRSPLLDILLALAVNDLGATMSEDMGRIVRRAALGLVAGIAEREARRFQ